MKESEMQKMRHWYQDVNMNEVKFRGENTGRYRIREQQTKYAITNYRTK